MDGLERGPTRSSAFALELATEVFRTPGWAENFGGDAWSLVARLLRDHLRGRVIARVFVDQCFSLEHNTGSVFNKLYETETLAGILDAQYRDDYRRSCDTRRRRFGRAGSSTSGDGARNTIPSGSASR